MSDLETLKNLNEGYIRSVRASDVRWFEENLADDFLNSGADGSLADRGSFLKQIARPLAVSDFGCEEVRIRILGELAIVHGRAVYTKPAGEKGAGRYTDVWAKRQGRWL